MYGLPIWQQNNPQALSIDLLNGRPPPNSAVLLNNLLHWVIDNALNPIVPDYSTVGEFRNA